MVVVEEDTRRRSLPLCRLWRRRCRRPPAETESRLVWLLLAVVVVAAVRRSLLLLLLLLRQLPLELLWEGTLVEGPDTLPDEELALLFINSQPPGPRIWLALASGGRM